MAGVDIAVVGVPISPVSRVQVADCDDVVANPFSIEEALADIDADVSGLIEEDAGTAVAASHIGHELVSLMAKLARQNQIATGRP